jgi:hypothetical protein
VVTDVTAVVGQVREASEGPLIRVVGGGSRRVEARLTASLPDGAALAFLPPGAGPGDARAGRLVGLAPAPEGGAAQRAFVELEGAPLPARTRGRLRATRAVGAGAVRIPAAALGSRDGHPVVLARAGEAPPRPVPVAVLANDGTAAVVEAVAPATLAAGERVALDPAALLQAEAR